MGKSKASYTLEEAIDLLKVNRAMVFILLAAVRADFNPENIGDITTHEMERIYQLMEKL
jgi:hypothetical protein